MAKKNAGEPPLSTADYAGIVLAAIETDIRHVHVRATVSAAVAAIFVTQIDLKALRGLEDVFAAILGAAILFLSVAAVSYFHYTQTLNRTRLEIVKTLPDVVATRDGLKAMASPWSSRFMIEPSPPIRYRPLLWYRLGQACFLTGAILTGVVLARLFVF